MSDLFYRTVRCVGLPPWTLAARPTVLHRERVPATGRVLLASNHLSPYDVPCLIATLRRPIDFLSITELFRIKPVAWFFSRMNCFPLDRGRRDAGAIRTIITRLEAERLVAMFPEGAIRRPEDSMLAGGRMQPGVARMARLGKAPIIPCVVLGTGVFSRPGAWMPLWRAPYGVAFGEAITVADGGDVEAEEHRALQRLKEAYASLYVELSKASGLDIGSSPWR